jgi:RNA polymerase sigma-70 factor (ECF subfamily)
MGQERQADDQLELREIFTRYERPLVRFAMHITGDADRARDVVQDTFIRLCRAVAGEGGAVPAPDGVAGWLFRVCRNRALDVQKKERRMDYPGSDHLEARQSRGPSPASVVEARSELQEALQALRALPARQQEVVRLKLQAGLSYAQISEVTGHSVSHVGVLLHGALRAIREHLQLAATVASAAKGGGR